MNVNVLWGECAQYCRALDTARTCATSFMHLPAHLSKRMPCGGDGSGVNPFEDQQDTTISGDCDSIRVLSGVREC